MAKIVGLIRQGQGAILRALGVDAGGGLGQVSSGGPADKPDEGAAKPLRGKERAMTYDVAALLRMTQAGSRRAVPGQPGGPDPERRGEWHGDHRARAPRSARRSPSSSTFRVAGQGLRRQGAGCCKNRILPFGLNAIIARVYKGPSWLDSKECIVLDYSETSLVAHWIRDEIRLIGPGLYLARCTGTRQPADRLRLQF